MQRLGFIPYVTRGYELSTHKKIIPINPHVIKPDNLPKDEEAPQSLFAFTALPSTQQLYDFTFRFGNQMKKLSTGMINNADFIITDLPGKFYR